MRARWPLPSARKTLDEGLKSPVGLHFQIRDTGIGIPKSKTKNIFKAFSQLGTTRNSSQRGTGLGLVIAGELVEMMGGKICVESKAGVGTTFHFTVQFAPGPIKTKDHKTTEATSEHSARSKTQWNTTPKSTPHSPGRRRIYQSDPGSHGIDT